jgi:ABC-type multidrug transport system ATPase subunit
MTEADQLCDRVAFLSEGRIAALDTPQALKLRLGGQPEVDLLLADGTQERLRLDSDADGARLRELVSGETVRTIHSREATLADVFIALAGRSLDDDDDTGDDAERGR